MELRMRKVKGWDKLFLSQAMELTRNPKGLGSSQSKAEGAVVPFLKPACSRASPQPPNLSTCYA